MKIIHILKGKADPNAMNGVNKVVHHLATQQRLMGADVEVWGIANDPDIVRHEYIYRLRLFPSFRYSVLPGNDFSAAISELKRDESIVHMHSVFLPELFVASRFLKRAGVPWVLTPHGGYNAIGMRKNYLLKRLYVALIERRLVGGARFLHAIADNERRRLNQLFPGSDVVLITNGQELLLKPKRRFSDDAPSRPLFCFCGRLDKNHKGLDVMLDGFSAYRSSGGRGHLSVIGTGPDEVFLRTRASQQDLNGAVTFYGPLFDQKKIQQIVEADVFVMTSRWEGMPTAALEAASLSLPLLVTSGTNLGEKVRSCDAGIFVAPFTAAAIANGMHEIEQCYDAGTLAQMGDAARKMVETSFDWKQISAELVQVLHREV